MQQRKWVSFNNLIHDTNKIIGLEFYVNATFGASDSYTSYVPGKYIDYYHSTINTLFNFQPPPVCALVNYRQEHKVINEETTKVILDLFCRPDAVSVVEHGLGLRLKTFEFCQIPRARASYFVQNLVATSNHSQFIVKGCLGLLAILSGEPINLGRLIAKNIK